MNYRTRSSFSYERMLVVLAILVSHQLFFTVANAQTQLFTSLSIHLDAFSGGYSFFQSPLEMNVCRLDFRIVQGSGLACDSLELSYWGCSYSWKNGLNIPYVVGFLNNGSNYQLYPYYINGDFTNSYYPGFYCGTDSSWLDGYGFPSSSYMNATLMSQLVKATLIKPTDRLYFAYTETYTNCNTADNTGSEDAYVDIYQCDQPPGSSPFTNVLPVLSVSSVCFGPSVGSFVVPSTVEICGVTIKYLSGGIACDDPKTPSLAFGCNGLLIATYLGDCATIPCTRILAPTSVNGYPATSSSVLTGCSDSSFPARISSSIEAVSAKTLTFTYDHEILTAGTYHLGYLTALAQCTPPYNTTGFTCASLDFFPCSSTTLSMSTTPSPSMSSEAPKASITSSLTNTPASTRKKSPTLTATLTTEAPVKQNNYSPNARLEPVSTKITKSNAKKGIDIDLVATGSDQQSHIYGSVHLEANLVPVGWTVEVLPVNETDLQKPKPTSKCGDSNDDEESVIVSLAFNLVIKDEEGRERSLEDLLDARANKGIGLELSYDLSRFDTHSSRDRLRFAYLQDGDSAWKLLEDSSNIAFDDDFGSAKATTKHLTSFAILLSFGGFGDCESNVLWIVSLSLLGFVIVSSILIIILVEKVPYLKRTFYGYAEGALTITSAEKTILKKQTSTLKTPQA
eukprot:TRINITY_DN6118_c0_g1_i1.p1 TRINITY_DN6118_c0_g1~~TRINITY_DN6118_c0_g1_i1.p1  ORF type:complete len:680 (-),score=127.69 TRINITY_DN6118_c0_g1_i1:169-2208(-)